MYSGRQAWASATTEIKKDRHVGYRHGSGPRPNRKTMTFQQKHPAETDGVKEKHDTKRFLERFARCLRGSRFLGERDQSQQSHHIWEYLEDDRRHDAKLRNDL